MEPARILWIDLCSQPSDHELLRCVPRYYETTVINQLECALLAVRQCAPDFVCIEFDYPDSVRLQVVPMLRLALPALPLLMFTEYHSEAMAIWAFRSGVWDYRVKPIDARTLARSLEVLAGTADDHCVDWTQHDALPPDLIEPVGELSQSSVAPGKTGAAIAYISAHYAEPIRQGQLAALCHMSCSEFSRAFRREHGITFAHFLLEYRIGKARELLDQSDMTITQMAYAVGFNDLSYFCRAFRRCVGVPATGYRNKPVRHSRAASTRPHGADLSNRCANLCERKDAG